MNTTPKDERKTILIADDDPVFRTVISKLLGDTFRITAVSGSYSAIETLKHAAMPDLIVMETRLPDLNGLEAIQMIREELHCHVPALALTADCFAHEDQLLTAGFQNVLIKPVPSQLLKETCVAMASTASA